MFGPKHRVSTSKATINNTVFKTADLMLAMRLGLEIFKTVAKTAVLRKVIDRPLGAVVRREIE